MTNKKRLIDEFIELVKINSLTGKLGNIDGVVVKTAIAKREI